MDRYLVKSSLKRYSSVIPIQSVLEIRLIPHSNLLKLLDLPDTSNMSFNLGYLDCSFEHILIKNYLSLYQKRIDSFRKSNKTIYFKLRLLLSNQDYEYYKSQHTNNLSFEYYVLESLGYPCVDYVQIIRIEDLKDIRNQISRYAMSYFYYLNHGRI